MTTLVRDRLKAKMESSRLSQFGPMPTNPLRELRLSTELSLDQMALRMGISKQALIRVEQGTYDKILPSVLDYYVSNYDVSELVLVDGYEHYQEQMRKRHYLYFGFDLQFDLLSDTHPLRQLRDRIKVTPTELSKALCIPQATVEYFEKKYRKQQSVPKVLANVLNEIGYKNSEIKQFCSDYKAWRLRAVGRNVLGIQQ